MSMPVLGELLRELGMSPGSVSVAGEPSPAALRSPLAVADCAVAAVGACLSAAAQLALTRTGRRPEVALSTEHVALAVRGEVWLRDPAGHPLDGFGPLSRLWPAVDGWVRTHANYPWHRAALLAALGVADGAGAETDLAAAIERLPARELEHRVYEAGGLCVAARTREEWRAGEPGQALASAPLVDSAPLGISAVPLPSPGPLPAAGLRVLDLTRVIAGPVGTRMLGALGADVLRLDNPSRPELSLHAVDGVVGKRSAALDLSSPAGQATVHSLLERADLLVTGYRPGCLARFGLEPDQIAERHPHATVVTVSAWGSHGPWGGRRGFDSLVQVASGIGWASSDDGTRPGALPCQLLDHATGYLVAAGALAALDTRARTGQISHVQLSLARTAQWLLDSSADADADGGGGGRAGAGAGPGEPVDYLGALGDGWVGVTPPGTLDGAPLRWPHLPPSYAASPPAWWR